MRLSADPDDPGFAPWCQSPRVRVFFDGVEHAYVVTADEEKQMLVASRVDEAGRLMLNAEKTEILYETKYGHVRIERLNKGARDAR